LPARVVAGPVQIIQEVIGFELLFDKQLLTLYLTETRCNENIST
jgi:hypothetical protein